MQYADRWDFLKKIKKEKGIEKERKKKNKKEKEKEKSSITFWNLGVWGCFLWFKVSEGHNSLL